MKLFVTEILESVEEVESIWKFYEIIGYDYKKKRFVC